MNSKYVYPVKYIRPVQLKNGVVVQLRPIHPVDGEAALEFKEKLSEESIYNRFLGYVPSISPKLVQRLTEINYEKEMAIIAEIEKEDEKEIIAVARIAPENEEKVEFAIIVADDWHGKGIGNILTDEMIAVSRDLGFQKVYALLFVRNQTMMQMLKKRNFTFKNDDFSIMRAELILKEN